MGWRGNNALSHQPRIRTRRSREFPFGMGLIETIPTSLAVLCAPCLTVSSALSWRDSWPFRKTSGNTLISNQDTDRKWLPELNVVRTLTVRWPDATRRIRQKTRRPWLCRAAILPADFHSGDAPSRSRPHPNEIDRAYLSINPKKLARSP